MKIVRNILLAVFVVAALAYINASIPAPQKIEARTYQQDNNYLAQDFPCDLGSTNVIHIGDEETPACTNSTTSDLSQYQGGVNISLENTAHWYRVHWSWGSYYCSTQDQLTVTNGHTSCVQDKVLSSDTVTLKPGDFVHATMNKRNDINGTCGYLQNDFAFTVDVSTDNGQTWQNNVCGSGNLTDPGQAHGNATYTYCGTGSWCSVPTNTPTSTPTNTPTATPTTPVTPPTATPTTPVTVTPTPYLVVKKHVINDDGGTKKASDFTLYVENAGTGTIIWQGAGSEDGVKVAIDSNVLYSVFEGDHTGYTENPDGDCYDTLGDAPSKTCTIVNNDTPVTTPSASCFFSPSSFSVNDGTTAQASLFFSTNNLYANNKQVTVCFNEDGGTPQFLTSTAFDFGGFPISLNVSGGHTYTTQMYMNDSGVDSHACSGTVAATCTLTTTSHSNNGGGQSQNQSQTQNNNQTVNVNINNTNQQQQQQAVLGASVAPAINASRLPATGAGADVLLTLASLLPLGLKLRKLV